MRLADAAMAERCTALVRSALACGGGNLGGAFEPAEQGIMRPACVSPCPRDAELVQGDHFGPVLAVVPVDGIGDALALHRSIGQALATSIYCRDPESVLADPGLVAALGSNVVTVNDTVIPTGHPAASIEGRGQSGWGASRGEAGLRALTREVVVSTTSRRLRTPLDEPDASGKRWLRRLAIGGRDPAAPSAATATQAPHARPHAHPHDATAAGRA